MSANYENGEVSMTYGDLYQKHPILADCIASHEWDNMNLSEQRDWALSQADGHKSQRFKEAHEASKTIAVWTGRALTAEMRITPSAEPPVFLSGQRVMVNNEQYHGEGIVSGDDRVHRRMVHVLLGNGNTWPYEVETVSLVDAGQWTYEREQIVQAEG